MASSVDEMRRIDVHSMTETQLALIKRELCDEIRDLRGALHSVGPSAARDDGISERYAVIDEIDRELAHRRVRQVTRPNH